jgi:polyhydroxyalkanoate synthase
VSRARGYLDGRPLAEVFAWLRPNDLIWNYFVNDYLLGRKPPPFDILFWKPGRATSSHRPAGAYSRRSPILAGPPSMSS